MRNLKKLLAVIVSVCVLATFALPAFAAELTAAEIVEDLGVLKGDSSEGVSDAYLAKGTTRDQAAILYLRLIGKEDEAYAFEGEENFTDADQTWKAAQKALAYLKANPDLGWEGRPDGTFDPKAEISAQELYKVLLESLGYKQDAEDGFKWADVFTFAADKGLSLIADVTDMTNNDVAIALVEVLKLTLKGSETTLIADLVAKGVVTEAAAEAAGLIGGAVALDVSGAVALNSKIVEVSLDTAATAKDVAAATFAVKDAAAKEIAVTGAEVAPWSADGKSVLVTLGADTAVGTLYTLTVGDKSFNFGGKAVDTGKPTATVESTDYNEVVVTFSEAIKIETAKVTIAKSYDDKAALETTAVKYDGSSKLVYTTADQADATLYKVVVENAADLAGNVMEKAELSIVGKSKPTADQEVSAAKALDYKTLYVAFGVNVDFATVAATDFTVVEMYGSKATIAVADAKQATNAQTEKYDAANNTDALKTAAAKKGVVLTLTDELKDATLYKVTVAGVNTLYGKALSTTEAKTYTMFTGVSKPGADSVVYTASATSNTEVTLDFANDVDKTTGENIANYAITKTYGDKAVLAITKAVVDGDKVKLTVASMTVDMYQIVATGILDAYGNSIKTSGDANKQLFAGIAVAGKLTDATITDNTGTTGTLRVDFGANYGDGALDVSSYVLDQGIGYPSKVAKVSGSSTATAVDLTIPKTTTGTVYKITIKNVKNADGVAMDAAGFSKNFIGTGGATAAAPKLEGAVALNDQAIKLYFSKAIKDISDIDTTDATTLAAEFVLTGANDTTPDAAVVDETNDKVVILYTATANGFEAVSGNTVTVTTPGTILDTDHDSIVVAQNTAAPAAIKVDGIVATSKNTLRLYFNQPIRVLGFTDNAVATDEFAFVDYNNDGIYTDGTDGEIVAARAVNTDKTQWEVRLSVDTPAAASYKLVINTGAASALISNVTAAVRTVGMNADVTNVAFAGNTSLTAYIKDVYTVATDARTLVVYFPEEMDETDVETTTNYAVTTGTVIDAEYNSTNKTATLKLSADVATATDNLVITADTIYNAIGNKSVKTDANANLSIQFAKNATAPAKLAIKEVKAAGQEITVIMNQKFKTATNVTTTDNNLLDALEIKINGTTALVDGDIAVVTKLGDATVADSSAAYIDRFVITVSPGMTLNGQGSVDFLGTVTEALTTITGQLHDGDAAAVVFAQK